MKGGEETVLFFITKHSGTVLTGFTGPVIINFSRRKS